MVQNQSKSTSRQQFGINGIEILDHQLLNPCSVDILSKELECNVSSEPVVVGPQYPTCFLVTVCLSACFTMATNMVHYMIVNLPEKEVKIFVNESYHSRYTAELSERGMLTLWGFVVGAPMAVAAVGAASVNFFAEKFGRKISLFLIHNVILMMSCFLCLLAKPLDIFEFFIAGRLLFGFSYGFSLTLVGIYTTECSPPQFRGLAGSFIGLLCLSMLSFYGFLCMPVVLGHEDTWPYVFLIAIVCATFSMISGLFLLPESPKYTYIVQGNKLRAIRDIQRLQGTTTNIDAVLKTYDKEVNQTTNGTAIATTPVTSLRNILQRPHLRKGLAVGVAAILIRAFCGCEVFVVHGTSWIVKAFGFTSTQAQYIILTTCVLQLIPTMVTPLFIERCDSRPLLLYLTFVMIILNLVFVISIECYNAYSYHLFAYIGAVSLAINQLMYLFGLTPLGFIICSIVTPQEVRSKCASISYTFYYSAVFVQWFGFPIVYHLIGSYAVLLIAVIPSAMLWIYLYKHMPLTKGLPVNQIIEQWMTKSDLELLQNLKTDTDL